MKREKLTDYHKNKNTAIKKKEVINVVLHPTLKVSDVPQVDISANIAVR